MRQDKYIYNTHPYLVTKALAGVSADMENNQMPGERLKRTCKIHTHIEFYSISARQYTHTHTHWQTKDCLGFAIYSFIHLLMMSFACVLRGVYVTWTWLPLPLATAFVQHDKDMTA